MSGIIERSILLEELHGEESWTSSEPCDDLCDQLICPTLSSYSSLELLSCSDNDGHRDEEECRSIKLNNAIKRLIDVIDDPVKREDVSCVCALLCGFLKYNGVEGYILNAKSNQYVGHLHQIGEILEFLCARAKDTDEYHYFLHQLLQLAAKPLRLRRSSESLTCLAKLKRYFSLLGYLLVLVPTKTGFLALKSAIEAQIDACGDESEKEARCSVKPETRREAVEASRLPVTLAELAQVASDKTYPSILEMVVKVASVSKVCCYRMLEAGMQNTLLIRMHPPECKCESEASTTSNSGSGGDDITNSQLDKADHRKSLEYTVEILRCLVTSTILPSDDSTAADVARDLIPPNRAAMRSLRAALRLQVLRSGASSRGRKLRNELSSLLLASLVSTARAWELLESGIAEDLAVLVTATECGTAGTWAEDAIVETSDSTGLTFKKTLLMIVAMMVERMPSDVVNVLKNKKIIAGLLCLVNPRVSPEASVMTWSSEQLWHLFKYASNALTYLAPKVPDEFIECDGSLGLLSRLEQLARAGSRYDEALVARHAETICSLSSENCDAILRDFRNYDFVAPALQLIQRVLQLNDGLTINRQKILSFLLVSCQNIMNERECARECHCDSVVGVSIDLLRRCLNQRVEDSQLEQSFLVSISCFVRRCLIPCASALDTFATAGGLYLLLDITATIARLPVQNHYLGLLDDVCENEPCCACYLLAWRCAADRTRGVISLLASVWREEERLLGVERTADGCIENTDSPLKSSSDRWLYLHFSRSARNPMDTAIAAAVGSTRPRICRLYRAIERCFRNYRRGDDFYDAMLAELELKDRITLLAIAGYEQLRKDEVTLEIAGTKVRPLSRGGASLASVDEKLSGAAGRIKERQERLIELSRDEERVEESEVFERIREAKLNPAYDALDELTFVARTSCGEYRARKVREMREEIQFRGGSDESGDVPFFRTFEPRVDVTTVFNQRVKVQSIPDTTMIGGDSSKTAADVSRCSASSSIIADATLKPNCATSSSCSLNSDSSLLLKDYEIDAHGNVLLNFCK